MMHLKAVRCLFQKSKFWNPCSRIVLCKLYFILLYFTSVKKYSHDPKNYWIRWPWYTKINILPDCFKYFSNHTGRRCFCLFVCFFKPLNVTVNTHNNSLITRVFLNMFWIGVKDKMPQLLWQNRPNVTLKKEISRI